MTRKEASEPDHVMLDRIEMSRTAATAQKCSRNTTNSKPRGAYFAHVFEKYNDFKVCRKVSLSPRGAHFAHVFEKYNDFKVCAKM